MDIEDVNRRLADIERSKDDFEVAHVMQDDLFRDALTAIADGEGADPALLALAVLQVDLIGFGRSAA